MGWNGLCSSRQTENTHKGKSYCQVHPLTKTNTQKYHTQETGPAAPVCLLQHCETNLRCSLYLHLSKQQQPSGSISQSTAALRVESSSKSEDTSEDTFALLHKLCATVTEPDVLGHSRTLASWHSAGTH